MNVILEIISGRPCTPLLIVDNVTAQSTFEGIARKYLGEDISEVQLCSDYQVPNLNRLFPEGVSVEWYEDVEVNDYRNINF